MVKKSLSRLNNLYTLRVSESKGLRKYNVCLPFYTKILIISVNILSSVSVLCWVLKLVVVRSDRKDFRVTINHPFLKILLILVDVK